MIKHYANGNELLEDNRDFLNTNPDLACFFFWDAPLLKRADKTNYALCCEDKENKLLALKVEPYNLLLFGEPCLVPEIAEYLMDNGYEVKNYLCSEDVGDTLMEFMGNHGIEYYEALAMDFMEVREKTEETSDKVVCALPEDADEIYECLLRFGKDCGLLDEVHREDVEKTIDKFRLIKENGQIVSMAKLAKASDTAYRIACVYTKDEYRGKDYAKQVVNAVKNEILDMGMTATLNVDKKNPVSNRLYKSLGFKRVFSQGEYRKR